MVKTIFLFPGQGAQHSGMGKDLWETYEVVKHLFDEASHICGQDMKHLLFEADEQVLKQTVNTQTAVTLMNISVREVLQLHGITSCASAGFSLGELSALYDAGTIGFEDLMILAKHRAETLDACSRFLSDQGGGPAMAAVIGLDFAAVSSIVAEKRNGHVYASNDNSPTQVSISGLADAVNAIKPALMEAGARRVIPLKVSGPFHTPLLQDAADMFRESLDAVQWKPFSKPCCSNASGGFFTSPEEVPELCWKQIVSPVRWVDVMKHLKTVTGHAAVESGPGTVLTGLWKSVVPELPCFAVGSAQQVDALKDQIQILEREDLHGQDSSAEG